MALLDFIFGEKAQPAQVAGFQQPFLEDLFARAQQVSRGPAISPVEMQGQQMALGAARGLQPQIAGAQRAGQFLTDPGLLSPMANPFLAQTAQAAARPVLQGLTEQILPQIRREAIGAGGFGGTRQDIASGLAGRGALQTIGDISGDIFSRAYGQGLGALQQGLALAPQTAALGLMPSQVFRDVGREQRLAPFDPLERLRGILGGPTVLPGTPGRPGLASQIGLGLNI